jgi:hypothetical protein
MPYKHKVDRRARARQRYADDIEYREKVKSHNRAYKKENGIDSAYYYANQEKILEAHRQDYRNKKLTLIEHTFERLLDRADGIEDPIITKKRSRRIPVKGKTKRQKGRAYPEYEGNYYERRAQWRKDNGYFKTEEYREYNRTRLKARYHKKKNKTKNHGQKEQSSPRSPGSRNLPVKLHH